MFKYPIAISLSPNTEKDDVFTALKIILQPWKWKNGSAIGEVEKWFCKYYQVEEAVLFNSGRSALYSLLQTFDIGVGDEVIIQAFTCVAVPDPVIWVGAKPVYADIDASLNIDPVKLEKSVTNKTRAIIVQHTFGIPAKIDLIKKIAQKHNLILIEDCAHSLGSSYHDEKIGSFGDAAFFSFGRDKVISSVFGGAAIINRESRIKNHELRIIQKNLTYPSFFWIFQQILHPIAFSIILPLYNFGMGKLILFLLQRMQLLSKPVYLEEMRGKRPKFFPSKYPDALALLLLNQLKKLDLYNSKRKEAANYYFKSLKNVIMQNLPSKADGAIYLRFNIMTVNREKIFSSAKKKNILLGNWYHNIIDPKNTLFEVIGYKKGSCRAAENTARLSLNLPTYPRLTKKDLKRIVEVILNAEV